MNIIRREWKANAKQTMFWSIGILSLLFISFYKMQGLASTPGGIGELLKSLPPVLQAFFGATSNEGSGIGTYQMIHMYMTIALALHAVMLGAHIFTKEEQDKTFEFLYVKGVSRYQILWHKILASISILWTLLFVTLLGLHISVFFVGYDLAFGEIAPYVVSLCMVQFFFFSLALWISVMIRCNQKAGTIGISVVFIMFMITMYVKIGGNVGRLDACSIFHYADSSYIGSSSVNYMPYVVIIALSMGVQVMAQILHNRRDLLN